MFSVYGVTGQSFHGSLEQLLQVTGPRHGRTLLREGEELGPESLPVGRREAGTTAGYEAAADAYREMIDADSERGPLYHAYQIMTRKPVTVSTGDGVERAWRRFAERHVHQAPVLDDVHRVVGIVSERDLLTGLNVLEGQVRDVLPLTVADVMATPVVSADPVTDIRRIARVMLEYGLSGVPVVSETGSLAGFVSRGDILRAVMVDPPLSLWG